MCWKGFPRSAATARCIALSLQTDKGFQVEGTFTAPVIAESDLPPLLGLKSLKAFGVLLDMNNKKLYPPGPQDVTSKDAQEPKSSIFRCRIPVI